MDVNYLCEKIKKGRSLRFPSNCYSLEYIKNSEKIWEIEDSFLFSYEDHGIKRLSFFVEDYNVLDKLLSEIDKGKYYIEIMTNDPSEYNNPQLKVVAKMMRMSNPDCSSILSDELLMGYKDDSVAETAGIADAEEINHILWDAFDSEVSHLLYDDELKEIIIKNQVFIHRGNRIDALLQADIKPKKFYINQIVNKADKSIIHAIVIAQLEKYIQGGGKYLYAWVDEANIASVKFHKKYGMKHDGMWNIVYCLDKNI